MKSLFFPVMIIFTISFACGIGYVLLQMANVLARMPIGAEMTVYLCVVSHYPNGKEIVSFEVKATSVYMAREDATTIYRSRFIDGGLKTMRDVPYQLEVMEL